MLALAIKAWRTDADDMTWRERAKFGSGAKVIHPSGLQDLNDDVRNGC